MNYNDLSTYLKSKYGRKLYKIALDAGRTCPNRDGSCGSRGCIFCSGNGSGEFAADRNRPVSEQLQEAKAQIQKKLPQGDAGYIAYFQAFTSTYGTVEELEPIFREAIKDPEVVILSIATRPDCLPPDILAMLERLNRYKPVWVELGLQTIHEDTARYIRRGYPLSCFDTAVKNLRAGGIEVIVHTILGLPGESRKDILETMAYLNAMDIQGIKLQLLHVLRGTDLAADHEAGLFRTYERDEYLNLVIDCLEHLRPDIVIHRVTGDGPKDLLIAPEWSLDKRGVLNALHHRMKKQGIRQGDLFQKDNYS